MGRCAGGEAIGGLLRLDDCHRELCFVGDGGRAEAGGLKAARRDELIEEAFD
jgi:hypothetical protein